MTSTRIGKSWPEPKPKAAVIPDSKKDFKKLLLQKVHRLGNMSVDNIVLRLSPAPGYLLTKRGAESHKVNCVLVGIYLLHGKCEGYFVDHPEVGYTYYDVEFGKYLISFVEERQ